MVVVDLRVPCWKFGTTGIALAFGAANAMTHKTPQVIQIPVHIYLMVSSEVSCPIAKVFPEPAVIVMVPSEPMVPAKLPAVPAAVETMLPKFATSPVVIADVGTASAWV